MEKSRYKIIVRVSFIVLILTISYSICIYQFQNDNFVSWLNTFFSTIISVLLALIIAIYIFYYQTDLIQKEIKNKFIPLIEMELIDDWKFLSNLENPMKIRFSDRKELDFYLFKVQNIIFEQAICSNVFDKEQTEFLLKMKGAIDFHNSVIEQFINMNRQFDKNPDIYRKSLEFLYNNHDKSKKELKKIILTANNYFEFEEFNKKIK